MDKEYVSGYVKAMFTAIDVDELIERNKDKSKEELDNDGYFPVSVYLDMEQKFTKKLSVDMENQQISHKLVFEVVNNAVKNARYGHLSPLTAFYNLQTFPLQK